MPPVNKNHLELRSNSPQWVYSTAPLVKPDGTPVDHPQAGAAGYAMSLNDRQVSFGRVGFWGRSFRVQSAGTGLAARWWVQGLRAVPIAGTNGFAVTQLQSSPAWQCPSLAHHMPFLNPPPSFAPPPCVPHLRGCPCPPPPGPQVLILPNFHDFPSDAITVEFWMNSIDTCRPGVPFSYAHGDYEKQDNSFLVFNYNSFGVSDVRYQCMCLLGVKMCGG
jgi:hypothetical protein